MPSSAFQLVAPFTPAGDQPTAIAHLVAGLQRGLRHQTLLGVTGSGKTLTIAHIIAQSCRPTLVLAPNKTLAAQFYGEMKAFFPHNAVEYFISYYDYYQPEAYVPSTDTFIDKDASINQQIEQMRLSATKALIERQDVIIIASVSAIYGLGDPDCYLKMVLHLHQGAQLERQAILEQLVALHYERNDHQLQPGTFRVRGEVIDVYPAEAQQYALRIEFFAQEIERLLFFDPLTGHVVQRITRYTLYPKTHYVTTREQILSMIEQVKVELQQRYQQLHNEQKLLEAQRLMQRVQYDIEMMQELGYCSGIENYSRYLSGRQAGEPPPTLLDYLPQDGLLVIDESHVTIPQLGGMYRGDRARKETLVKYGFRLPSALDNRPLTFEEFNGFGFQTIYVSATPGSYELAESGCEVVEQVVRPTGLLDPQLLVRPATNQVDDLLSEICDRVARKERVLVTTLTKRMAQDLSDYLEEHGVQARYLHSEINAIERMEIIHDLRLGTFDVLVGINLLREGLDLPEVALVAILDADKEGFLRSTRSLIQTIGRAARHLNGTAILYGDTVTVSMQQAIDETERRRIKQMVYNSTHGIVPRGLQKPIVPVLKMGAEGNKVSEPSRTAVLLDKITLYRQLSPKQQTERITLLQQQMYQHANNLEFEQAAQIRDQIQQLQQIFLESS